MWRRSQKHVSKTLSHLSVLLQLCGTALHPWVLWTVYEHFCKRSVVVFPTDSPRNWTPPTEIQVCVLFTYCKPGDAREPLRGTVLLLLLRLKLRESGKMCDDNVNTNLKIQSSILYSVNRMVIYFLLCCVYGNFLISIGMKFYFLSEGVEMYCTVFFIIVGLFLLLTFWSFLSPREQTFYLKENAEGAGSFL